MTSSRRLSLIALVIAVGMLLGRITGFARELIMAANYGLSWEADVAMLAIALPDLLNAILIGGAVSAVLIPDYHRLRSDSGEVIADELACQFLVAIGVASTVAAVIVAMFGHVAINILAPGLTGQTFDNAVLALRVVMVALPMCALAAVTSAILQSSERVLTPAFGTLIFNSVVILGLVAMPLHVGSFWLGIAVIAAAGVRLATQIIECLRCNFLFHGWSRVLRFDQLRREHFRRYCQTFGAIGLTLFIPFVARAFASHVEGGIACFNYAYKLVELPFGLLAGVISMAIFPKVSQLAQERAGCQMKSLLSITLAILVLVTVPIIVFVLGAAEPVVAILFQRGQIGPLEVQTIAHLARLAFLALPALTINTFLISTFHAYRDTRAPFVISLAVGASLVILCLSLDKQVSSLMAAVTVVQWLNAIALLVAFRLSHGSTLGKSEAAWQYVLGILASVAFGLLSWSFRSVAADWVRPVTVASIASTFTVLAWMLVLVPLIRRGPIADRQRPTVAQSAPIRQKLAA